MKTTELVSAKKKKKRDNPVLWFITNFLKTSPVFLAKTVAQPGQLTQRPGLVQASEAAMPGANSPTQLVAVTPVVPRHPCAPQSSSGLWVEGRGMLLWPR